jgi:hypothetical protein
MNLIQKIAYVLRRPETLNYVVQRWLVLPGIRAAVARLVASRMPRFPTSSAPAQEIGRALEADGIRFVEGLLSEAQCLEARAFLTDKPLHDRGGAGPAFMVDSPGPDCHVGVHRLEDVAACPHLLDLANHPLLLAAAAAYLGCKPTISTFQAWWSFGGHDAPKDAEFFHRDVDDWKFVKFFLYLTDVDSDCGPHVFVRKSHKVSKLLRIRRYSDKEVEDIFGQDDFMRITGKTGTAFLENTFGFHKGTLCKTGPRLIFQVQYSLLPIFAYEYKPVSIGERARNVDVYVNRLFVKG